MALVNIDAIKDGRAKLSGQCLSQQTRAEFLYQPRRNGSIGNSDKILQGLPTAVYTTDAGGRITFYNEAAAEPWGVRPELGKSEFSGSWKLYWSDGTPLPHDDPGAGAEGEATHSRHGGHCRATGWHAHPLLHSVQLPCSMPPGFSLAG